MRILNYSKVRLVTNAYVQDGVGIGSIGYVIEVYPDERYEVEFSDKDGITIAQLVLGSNELIVIN